MAYDSSAANRLAAVRDAIDKCLKSQAYTVRGRNLQHAQLSQLRALEKEILAEVEADDNGGKMASLGQIIPTR